MTSTAAHSTVPILSGRSVIKNLRTLVSVTKMSGMGAGVLPAPATPCFEMARRAGRGERLSAEVCLRAGARLVTPVTRIARPLFVCAFLPTLQHPLEAAAATRFFRGEE
jgi:hypothetical protein